MDGIVLNMIEHYKRTWMEQYEYDRTLYKNMDGIVNMIERYKRTWIEQVRI